MAKPKLDAAPAYEMAHLISNDLISRIGELLSDLPSPEPNNINWSDVGSLTEVNNRLSSVVAFLENKED